MTVYWNVVLGSADPLRECKSVNHLVASFIDSLAVEKRSAEDV